MNQRLIFGMIFLFLAGLMFSQEENISPKIQQKVEFDETALEKWKNEKEFSYLDQETASSWWTQFKLWITAKFQNLLNWFFGDYQPGIVMEFFIMLLPYLFLLVVLFFAAWLFVRLNPAYAPAQPAVVPKVFFSEEEKIMNSRDISALIEGAISNEDYRLAVRYLFLRNLRKMNKMGIIKYHLQKTNQDYLGEIPHKSLKLQFTRIIRLYEYIWYGDFKVTEEDFQRAQDEFEKMENMLNFTNYA